MQNPAHLKNPEPDSFWNHESEATDAYMRHMKLDEIMDAFGI